MMDYQQIEGWLRQAGELALRFYSRETIHIEHKIDGTPVTQADKAVDAFLVERIKSSYPTYEIISEEGARFPGSDFSWVIDPIDGTAAYIGGVPTWCISIGLLHNLQPYWGMVFLPPVGDLYSIDENGDATLNGRKIASPPVPRMDQDAILCISAHAVQAFDIRFPGNIYALGSGVLHNCLTARGVSVGNLSLRPNLWDLAAVASILRATGRTMEYLSGGTVNLADLYTHNAPRPILTGHPETIQELRLMIKQKSHKP
jgi:myo-inositol-1(or 4)-monophosphatase